MYQLFLQPKEKTMKSQISVRQLSSAALAACSLMLAAPFVLAADAPFPTGTFSTEGHKVTLAFEANGEFRVMQGDALQVSGRYTVKGGQVTMIDSRGPWACTKAGQTSGKYHWSYQDSMLGFSTVSDQCTDRMKSLTTTKWTKQP